MAEPTVLLSGATSAIGQAILLALVRSRRYTVRVLVEPHAATARIAALPGVSIVRIDVSNAAACVAHRRVADGCCAVVSVLHMIQAAPPTQLFQVVRDSTLWLYHAAIASSVPQFIMVGTVYSQKHPCLHPLFEAWEQCILHIRAHRELMPTSPSRPSFSILDFAPTFAEIEHELTTLARQAACAIADPDAPPPIWPTLGDGLLLNVSPIHQDDLGRHTVSVVGNAAWHDRRGSCGGPSSFTWMAISLACFKSLQLLPHYEIQPLWGHILLRCALCMATKLGLRGLPQNLQDMTALQLRCTVDASATCTVGDGDVMAHIAETGQRLAAAHGLLRADGTALLSKVPPERAGWWVRVAAPIAVLFALLLLVDFFF